MCKEIDFVGIMSYTFSNTNFPLADKKAQNKRRIVTFNDINKTIFYPVNYNYPLLLARLFYRYNYFDLYKRENLRMYFGQVKYDCLITTLCFKLWFLKVSNHVVTNMSLIIQFRYHSKLYYEFEKVLWSKTVENSVIYW